MKPILFSAPMVIALLDGRKTKTRRVIKFPEGMTGHYASCGDRDYLYYPCGIMRPKYQVGDVLWVRETWRVGAWNENDGSICVDYKAENLAKPDWIPLENEELFERLWIQSTNEAMAAGVKHDEEGQYHWKRGDSPCRWRPSIFMPKEATRIFLRVTSVHAERVQDITVEDAIAEGIECDNAINNPDPQTHEGIRSWNLQYAQFLFKELWDHINQKRGYGWNRNPWVFVYGFEQISKEEAERSEEKA